MTCGYTNALSVLQPLCVSAGANYFVEPSAMKLPSDPSEAGCWAKAERERRGLSAKEMALRINGLAKEAGDPTTVSQQVVSKYEQGDTKKVVGWHRFIVAALEASDDETKEDPFNFTGLADSGVEIELLPTFAGLGSGGTGEGDPGKVTFSRDLVERELRASPANLLAMQAEGNSMEPDYRGGDQILVDTRRKSLAQPGAFCLWDGDGHVIKFVERIPDTDPVRVRLNSANGIYPPRERLLDEINLVGKVVWFGRQVK